MAGVLTDVGLATDTDGLEIARLVTEAFPGIAVVVTSGRFADRPVGLDDGVRYLTKPWLPLNVLSAMIDASLEQ